MASFCDSIYVNKRNNKKEGQIYENNQDISRRKNGNDLYRG